MARTQILLEEGRHNLETERGGIFNNRLTSIKPIEIDYLIKVLSIKYDIPAAISQTTPKTLYTGTQENNTSVEQRDVVTQGKTVTVTNSSQFRWSRSFSSKISIGTIIKAPFISSDI